MRADDLESDALLLECLAPRDEGREQQIRECAVVEQQQPQLVAIDSDVAHRLGDDGCHEHRLAGQQVQLAQEAGGAVAHDLAPRGVQNRRLTLDESR